MVVLALSTQIPVREWEEADDATIATALQLLENERNRIEEERPRG